ncbi:MAG: acyl-CoA dehydrogenase family protein [Acidimicrobiia bacterium]
MTITERRSAAQELTDEMLERFRTRAARADGENEYFHDDLAELREIGYLGAAVPERHGGWGLDLQTLAASQRRIARHAPATALGMTMHHYWVGIAVELERAGDDSCSWILHEAAAGTVFAAGHAEAGNDAPVVLSTTSAERVDGGYRFTGHKMFGSNGPAWSYLGVHGMDLSDPTQPRVVHGFVSRDSEGLSVVETWDALGMRPSQSHDTLLDGVFVPDERIGAIVPAGSEADLFLIAMNIWALPLIANVYVGIAERALELAIDAARRKTSIAIPRGTYAYNPMVQHQVAEMYLELDAARATVDRLIADWSAGADHGERWGAQIVSAKWRAVTAAKRVVDLALDVVGGGAMSRRHELERLYRDVRCGGFHPANDALTHEMVGKIALGIADEQPRW